MTVSLALRGDPRIRSETRARVLAAAEQIGYRRNPLVAALMADLRGRHPRGEQVIAYVESYPESAPPQQYRSLRRFRIGAEECAHRHGYRIERFRFADNGLSETRLAQILSSRGIHGVVFAPFPGTGTTLQLGWEHFAMATIGFSLASPALHRAVNHQVHSMRLALASLMSLGYRRIGLVMSRHEDARTERNWLSSVLLAQYECTGTDRKFPLLLEDRITRAPLMSWIRQHRPEVILSTEASVRGLLGTSGRSKSPTVGFAHLHLANEPFDCTGIDQNNELVGAAAVDLVIEQLHGNQYGFPTHPKTVLIEGRWIPGTTACGPIRRTRGQSNSGAVRSHAQRHSSSVDPFFRSGKDTAPAGVGDQLTIAREPSR